MAGVMNLPQYSQEFLRIDELVIDESVTGLIDGINIHFNTINVFTFGTLSVYLDGRKLSNLDYKESVNLHGFDLIIDTSDHQRLQRTLRNTEELRVSYIKSKSSGSGCIKNI